jgi:hypothetical protein
MHFYRSLLRPMVVAKAHRRIRWIPGVFRRLLAMRSACSLGILALRAAVNQK